MSEDQLAMLDACCDYLFVSTTEYVSRRVFEAHKGRLLAVATLSVGYDHIDLEAARDHHVAVFHSPGVLSDACAEIAIMLLLNATRRGREGDNLVRSGQWGGWAPTQLLGLGLARKRLGIFGMGRIGRAVAVRACPFGVEIHYHNRQRLPPELEGDAIYHASLPDFLGVCDILAITAPGGRELTGFFNRERIAMLPRNAVVVNIARGDMIDDDALIEALTDGRLFAAGLDVFNHEPHVDRRYFELQNVFLTPHIGSATEETREAMGETLLQGLQAFEQGAQAGNRLC